MFKNSIPNINDITMVESISIELTHVNVKLIEYVDVYGIILLSELSKGKIRNIRKVAKIGTTFPAIVTSIDVKNNISLSKRNISDSQIKQCISDFQKYKTVSKIVDTCVNILQNKNGITVDKKIITENFIDPLTQDINMTPDTIIFKLKSANENFESVYPDLKLSDNEVIDCFKSVLKKKFKLSDILVEIILEITCYEDNGAVVIKNNLIKLSEKSTEDIPFIVKILKAPYYSVSVKTDNPTNASMFINKIVSELKIDLEKEGANFKIFKNIAQTTNEFIPDENGSDNIDKENENEIYSDE